MTTQKQLLAQLDIYYKQSGKAYSCDAISDVLGSTDGYELMFRHPDVCIWYIFWLDITLKMYNNGEVFDKQGMRDLRETMLCLYCEVKGL